MVQPAQLDRKVSHANFNQPDNKPKAQPDNKPKVQPISEADRKIVVDLLGATVAQKLIELDENVQAKKPLEPKDRTVAFDSVNDRSQRATIHQVCSPLLFAPSRPSILTTARKSAASFTPASRLSRTQMASLTQPRASGL